MIGDSLNMMEMMNTLYTQVEIEQTMEQATLLFGPGSLLYLTEVNTMEMKDIRILKTSSQAQNQPQVEGLTNA